MVGREHCPKCSSRDNLTRYASGRAYCFTTTCDYMEWPDGDTNYIQVKRMPSTLIQGEVRSLRQRGITEETARHYGYKVGSHNDKPVHICPLHNVEGELVAQQLRTQDKSFPILGDFSDMPMFGTNLWTKGKRVVICEGSIDAMSVSQIQDNKWPVISVPNGAAGAAKAIKANMKYFSGNWEEIILMFDGDEAGRDAVKACAPLFEAGKCKIATLNGFKDANEALMAGKHRIVMDAIWNAKTYRPDGIVSLRDLREELNKPVEWGLSWFLKTLNDKTYGRRYGEVYCLGAGTGVGKTDFLTQQIIHDMQVLKERVGVFFLEQMPTETAIRLAGKHAGKLFHIPDGDWTVDDRNEAIDALEESDMIRLYDSFGVCEWDVVKTNIEYMHHSEGIKIFYIDHLTALATGQGTDERVELERITSDIAKIAKRLGVIITMVSHLATPDGKSHEEGGRVSIRHFKGSRAIGFWCHYMFGMERDQQAENINDRQTTTFRVLKDRYTGQSTGMTIPLNYNSETGHLYEKTVFDTVRLVDELEAF